MRMFGRGIPCECSVEVFSLDKQHLTGSAFQGFIVRFSKESELLFLNPSHFCFLVKNKKTIICLELGLPDLLRSPVYNHSCRRQKAVAVFFLEGSEQILAQISRVYKLHVKIWSLCFRFVEIQVFSRLIERVSSKKVFTGIFGIYYCPCSRLLRLCKGLSTGQCPVRTFV